MTISYVTNREGIQEKFDAEKIKEAILKGCRYTSVNPLELEAKVSLEFYDGITTKAIQDALVNTANSMTTLEATQWSKVAGNLWMDRLHEERSFCYDEFFQYVFDKYDESVYRSEIGQYSATDLDYFQSLIDPERDYLFDYGAVKYLTSRYLLDDELPQVLFMVTAMSFAANEKPEERNRFVKAFYDALSLRKISLATPLLANLRLEGKNTASCFIVRGGDSLDDFTDLYHQAARISAEGGGLGIDLSQQRAKGSWIRGVKGASGGIIPNAVVLNSLALMYNQQGKRAGAFTIACPIYHLDVQDFLDIQTLAGDPRRKAYDIFPQIVVNDIFMQRVEDRAEYTLFDPYEVKQVLGIDLTELVGEEFNSAYYAIETAHTFGNLTLSKRVNAFDLFKTILQTLVSTGKPYIAFRDTINKANPNLEFPIQNVNLCCESFSSTTKERAHVCNLLSLVAANIESYTETQYLAQLGTRMLDNAIDLGVSPIPETEAHNKAYRVIGVGIMGLADYLAKRSIKYGTPEAIAEINRLFEYYAFGCFSESVYLAEDRGTFGDYDKSVFKKFGGDVFTDHYGYKFSETLREEWEALGYDLEQYGIRNSQLMAIAPNTSTAIIMGCSPSVIPVYQRLYTQGTGSGAITSIPPYLDTHYWYYVPYAQVPLENIIDTFALMQSWVDTGISMELTVDLDKYTPKDIYDIYMQAWKSGIKAVYYMRSIKASNDSNVCEACSS